MAAPKKTTWNGEFKQSLVTVASLLSQIFMHFIFFKFYSAFRVHISIFKVHFFIPISSYFQVRV